MPQLRTHDGEIAYEVHGEGPPLLLIHAISAGKAVWAPAIAHFSPTRQVIVLDARGVGDSASIRGWRGVRERMVQDLVASPGPPGS